MVQTSVNLSVGMCNYVKNQVPNLQVCHLNFKQLHHSDMQYLYVCVGMSLCQGMCMYVQVCAKCKSGNTCIYLHILTIPIHTDISFHTCTYLYIHAILAIPTCVMDCRKILTAVTYLRDSCRYMHILLYTCRYPPTSQIPTTYSHILTIPAHTYMSNTYRQVGCPLNYLQVCGRYLLVLCRYLVGILQVSSKYLQVL